MTSSPTGSSVNARMVRCARSVPIVSLLMGAVIGSHSAPDAQDAEGVAALGEPAEEGDAAWDDDEGLMPRA